MAPRLAVALLACYPLLPPLLPAQQAAATASLDGTVINEATGQPIARALVSLQQNNQAVLTDNEGRFHFEAVSAGQVTLTAKRPGFAGDLGSPVTFQAVTVPAAMAVTIPMTPQCTITGQLLLSGDDAPDSLQVQLLRRDVQNGHGRWTIFRNTESTSEGRFRFGDLPPGSYLVHVGVSLDPVPARPPASTPAAPQKPRTGYVPAYYPGVSELSAAGVLTLKAGQQAEARMQLLHAAFYPVAIPVANSEDARGVTFEVTSDAFLGIPARLSQQDGMVHVDLPPGHYLLSAASFGPRPISGEREFDVSGSGAERPGPIALLPVSRIPVTVHEELLHPPATDASSNTPVTAATQISLNLQRQGSLGSTRGRRASLEDDAGSGSSGVSQLVGAAPGKYWVEATAHNGYIASMRSGGVDLLTNPLTVHPDGSASPIDVTVRDDYAHLSVTLGSALTSSTESLFLHLVPTTGAGAADYAPRVQPTLSTNNMNMAPDSYLVFVSHSREPIEYRNPSVMSQLAGKSQTVDLQPGASASVTVDSLVDAATDLSAEAAP